MCGGSSPIYGWFEHVCYVSKICSLGVRKKITFHSLMNDVCSAALGESGAVGSVMTLAYIHTVICHIISKSASRQQASLLRYPLTHHLAISATA